MTNFKFLASLTFLAFLFQINPAAAQNSRAGSQLDLIQDSRKYTIVQDLLSLEDDLIDIRIVPPMIEDSVVEFHIPRVVPGTYDVSNFGHFVKDLVALTVDGDTLKSEQLDINRWQIDGAEALFEIRYKMGDSYDEPDGPDIFEPSGTSNEEAVFLLNNFGYLGYIDGYQDRPFELQVLKPEGFYGASAVTANRGDSIDTFQYQNYFELHDNPILYCEPDTTSKMIGGARVELAVYSPNKVVDAEACLDAISDVMQGAANYLGGELPVDKYAVLIYCVPREEMGNRYGALEHHRSTVLYMPEMSNEYFLTGVRDITAHEFFHIVTPLSIHSEYIHDFDFIDPEMSEHIWLYEGVTEYNSHIVQMLNGIYSPEQFLEVIRDKFISNDDFAQNVPLTAASKYTLSYYKDQYRNFYEKGALAAMALDLRLIELSGGSMRLVDLLQNLGSVYHADTFFVDEDLFKIMADYSYPQIEEFMVRHFAANEPFPFERLLSNVGIDYEEVGTLQGWSLGCDEFSYNLETDRIIIASEEGIDEFGEDLGLEALDEIVSINGDTIGLYNFQEILGRYQEELNEGEKVVMRIARPKNDEGEYRYKTLKAKPQLIDYEERHLLYLTPEPNESQLRLRRYFLGL